MDSLQKKGSLEKIVVVPVCEGAEFCTSLHKMSGWCLLVEVLKHIDLIFLGDTDITQTCSSGLMYPI